MAPVDLFAADECVARVLRQQVLDRSDDGGVGAIDISKLGAEAVAFSVGNPHHVSPASGPNADLDLVVAVVDTKPERLRNFNGAAVRRDGLRPGSPIVSPSKGPDASTLAPLRHDPFKAAR